MLQEVVDESDGCGAKFSVTIVSSLFEGKPLLQRHRYYNCIFIKKSKYIVIF